MSRTSYHIISTDTNSDFLRVILLFTRIPYTPQKVRFYTAVCNHMYTARLCTHSVSDRYNRRKYIIFQLKNHVICIYISLLFALSLSLCCSLLSHRLGVMVYLAFLRLPLQPGRRTRRQPWAGVVVVLIAALAAAAASPPLHRRSCSRRCPVAGTCIITTTTIIPP